MPDPMGASTVGLVRSNNTVDAWYDLTPWGEVVSGFGALGLRLAGREWDAETQLYFNRGRYYDPLLGRFISEDPIGLGGGINLYAYAGNDPVNRADPFGLCPEGELSKYVLKRGESGDWSEEHQCFDEANGRWYVEPGPITIHGNRYPLAAILALQRLLNGVGDVTGLNSLGEGGERISRGDMGGALNLAVALPLARPGTLATSVAFKTAHAAKHLKGVGVAANAVEKAIAENILGKASGSHWGWVTAGGRWFQYRAYQIAAGVYNVGTYFPVNGPLIP